MIRALFAAILIAAPSLAAAQAAEKTGAPQRIRNVQVARGQACPPSTADEVVVCSTVEDPYRIPKAFRDTAPSAAKQSWVNRAATLDQDGRTMAGLPDTCSPVGTGGQTGCAMALNQQFAAEKRAQRRAQSSIP